MTNETVQQMESKKTQKIEPDIIEKIEQLLQSAKNNDGETVNALLDELTAQRETGLYQQLGKLTRDFHNALRDFSADSRLAEITGNEMGDARERLHFVVNKTCEAAELTMSKVEEAIPLCNQLIEQSEQFSGSWQKLTSREMKAEEFRELSKNIKVFLQTANNDGKTLKKNLNDILLAQDFQDITGQVIYKVIKLVEDVEMSLVNLVKLASEHIRVETTTERENNQAKDKDKTTLDGPVVPGVSDMNETVSGQDEVDDLLSSLGF